MLFNVNIIQIVEDKTLFSDEPKNKTIRRKRKMTNVIETMIVNLITKNPLLTAEKIKKTIDSTFNIKLSTQLIYNVFKKHSITGLSRRFHIHFINS